MMNRTTPASSFVRSASKVHGSSRVSRWLKAVVVGCRVLALTHNTQAGILVGYSFASASVGQTTNFTNNFVASNVIASAMTTRAMGTVGVVTGFLGVTDNNSYSNFTDGFDSILSKAILRISHPCSACPEDSSPHCSLGTLKYQSSYQ